MHQLNLLACILFTVCIIINPVKALHCYKCNSETNPECAGKAINFPLQSCEISDTQCFTLRNGKFIIRGCGSEVPKECTDDICNTEYCNSFGCNTVPKPTLYCVHCNGDSNCEYPDSLPPPKLCANYADNDECYTYVFSEYNVTRGCVSDHESVCKKDFCVTCNTDGCNRKSSTTYSTCKACAGNDKYCMGKTEKNGDCTVSTSLCYVLLGRPVSCFTYFKTNEFRRGCIQDLNESFDNNFLEICYRAKCNSKCITNCYECNSEIDPKCKTNLEEFETKICHDTSNCYECENEKRVIRGCGANDDKTQTCNQCQEEILCNNSTASKCISCSSDKDKNCIVVRDLAKMNTTQCDSIYDACVSKIHDTLTVRGCVKDVEQCDDPLGQTCTSCYSDLCNKDLIPEDRIFCHQCNDNTDCPDKQKIEMADACQHYSKEQNKCFSFKENNKVTRGCASDKDHEICSKEGSNCLHCDNVVGCNSEIAEAKSKCIICENYDSCAWAHKAENAAECKFDFMEPTCFTQIVDNKVRRGCATRDTCNDPNSNCFKCNEDACNTKAVNVQTCIRCDSIYDQNCFGGKEIPPTNCTAKETYFTNRGCYTIREDDHIRRGCITELTDQNIEECNANTRFCKLCTEQGCNNQEAPPGEITYKYCIACGPDSQQCVWGHPKESEKLCEFNRINTTCFTHVFENGAVIRGCGNDEYACNPSNENCHICDDNNCNDENFGYQQCYQCTGNAGSEDSCDLILNKGFVKNCSSELQTYEERGCYTKVHDKTVSRGCLVDLEYRERATCKDDVKQQNCEFCMEPQCNYKKPPNNASTLTHFSFVSLIILSGLILFKN